MWVRRISCCIEYRVSSHNYNIYSYNYNDLLPVGRSVLLAIIMMVRAIVAIVSLYLTVAVAVAAYNTTRAPVDDEEDYKGGEGGEGGWSASGKGCSPATTHSISLNGDDITFFTCVDGK